MDKSGDSAGPLVLLGKIIKPHSIRGEVKVFPFAGEPENFLQYQRILLVKKNGEKPLACKVERARVQKNLVLLKLDISTDRDQAEALVNGKIYLPEDALPKLAEGEFYLHELEGKQMVTESGVVIGTVDGILTSAGQDIARVKGSGREFLVPLVPEFLVFIGQDKIVVSLPPGLLEING